MATGHTGSDQVETVLYRLVSSPGRRALLGMAPRRDRIVRPLLGPARRHPRLLRGGGARVARGRVEPGPRLGPEPPAPRRHPGAARDPPGRGANMLATAAQLRDEQEIVERAVDEALERVGARRRAAGRAGPAGRRAPGAAAADAAAPGRAGGGRALLAWTSTGSRRSSGWPPVGGVEWSISVAACARWPSTASCGSCADAGHPGPGQRAALPVPGTLPVRRHGSSSALTGAPRPRRSSAPLDEPVLDAGRLAPTAHRAVLAGRRPHGAARAGRLEITTGRLQRPQGPAVAAAVPAGGGLGRRDRVGGGGRSVRPLQAGRDTAATIRLRARAASD